MTRRGERAKQASSEEDEHTRDESTPRNGCRHNIMATSTTELTYYYYSTQFVCSLHSCCSLHSFCSCFNKNAPLFARCRFTSGRIDLFSPSFKRGISSWSPGGSTDATIRNNYWAGGRTAVKWNVPHCFGAGYVWENNILFGAIRGLENFGCANLGAVNNINDKYGVKVFRNAAGYTSGGEHANHILAVENGIGLIARQSVCNQFPALGTR